MNLIEVLNTGVYMSWFESKDAKIRKSHIRDLIVLAAADGHIDKEEMEFVSIVAVNWGSTPKELAEILKNPQKVKFTVPETKEKRLMALMDLVFLMMIDGEIHQNELDFCQSIAPTLGFPPREIPQMVRHIAGAIKAKRKREDILNDEVFWD